MSTPKSPEQISQIFQETGDLHTTIARLRKALLADDRDNIVHNMLQLAKEHAETTSVITLAFAKIYEKDIRLATEIGGKILLEQKRQQPLISKLVFTISKLTEKTAVSEVIASDIRECVYNLTVAALNNAQNSGDSERLLQTATTLGNRINIRCTPEQFMESFVTPDAGRVPAPVTP